MTREAIRSSAVDRQISSLVHFTQAENLPGIMQHGLLSVAEAANRGLRPAINDTLRLDGHRDGISLSIAFPNCRMFYRYRMMNPQIQWVVLVIDSAILWRNDCAYCRYNAADARISSQPLVQLKTLAAFESMFAEDEGQESRLQQQLNSFDPTDEQAEVLSFERIDPQYITSFVFSNAETRNLYQNILDPRSVSINSDGRGYFASRSHER